MCHEKVVASSMVAMIVAPEARMGRVVDEVAGL